MKAYYYPPGTCGLTAKQGRLNLPTFETVTDPAQADCFVVNWDLRDITNEQILALPYLKGNERHHVILGVSDGPLRFLPVPMIGFRGDFTSWLRDHGETNSETLAWPVQDIGREFTGFEHDVCFVGHGSNDLTLRSCASVQRSSLKSFIQINDTFYGTWETSPDPDDAQKVIYYRKLFLDVLDRSRLSLSPWSIPPGIIRYRFYEALSMGRVPVLCGDYSLPPLQDRIDYSKCSILIAEKDFDRTGEILKEWLATHSDEEIVKMGQYGRQVWLEWLAPKNWEKVWCETVERKLNVQG